MAVIADTSPLNYLILIGADRILPALYTKIVIPDAVLLELQHARAPTAVARWAANLPAWIELALAPADDHGVSATKLGRGEREAIAIAQRSSSPVLLLMDEAAGRAEATRLGIETTGTLGILSDAAQAGLIDLPECLQQLRATNFYIPPLVVRLLLEKSSDKKS